MIVVNGGGIGITPAYAGKSCFRNLITIDSGDHPRLCGEKQPDTFGQLTQLGSPPPMRGKDLITRNNLRRYRITPAYAGKSSTDDRLIVFYKDHPRLCGEKCKYSVNRSLYAGSPPPMRGKGYDEATATKDKGITPAYAGKSFIIDCPLQAGQDHPRLCGEKAH